MTVAPRSPSSIVQYGPASTREKSATNNPSSGPGRVSLSRLVFALFCSCMDARLPVEWMPVISTSCASPVLHDEPTPIRAWLCPHNGPMSDRGSIDDRKRECQVKSNILY